MKRRTLLTLMAFVMSVALCACGDKKEEEVVEVATVEEIPIEVETTEDVVEETTTEEVLLEDELPEGMYFSELTNLPIDESLKNQRPIAAMIDNEKTALPHFGLTDADIVYEIMNSTKNDRITRFMAIVKDWGSIEQLGSIRSTRPTNVILAAEWNAILCHDGGPFYIDDWLAKPYSNNFSGGFARVDNGKAREFTEYIMTGDLEKKIANSKVETEYNEYYTGPHFTFAPKVNPLDLGEKADSIAASKIELPFEHNGSYLEYDEAEGVYKYFEYGQPHLDGKTQEQLSFTNLLIQKCTFSELDSNGYLIFNCLTATPTEGYYLTGGKAIPITWVNPSETEPTRYYDAEGNEITLNTGKTYIGYVPDDNWDELVIE